MALKKAEYSVTSQSEGSRGFEDLEAYKLSLDVMVNTHEVAKTFPDAEKYDLITQLKRSAKSAPANIAEGYGRYHYLDSLRFYYNARGSLNETLHHLITARLLGYIAQEKFAELYALTRQVERVLNGYIAWIKKQKQGSVEYGDKALKDDVAEYFSEIDVDEAIEIKER